MNLFQFVKLRRLQRIPVLTPALNWAVAGGLLLELSLLMSFPTFSIPQTWQDQIWYWTAVLLCCPLISILGSRRPTSRVWNTFIILPLIAVLSWPAVTVLTRFPELHPLDVQLPVLMGFALVIIMGVGNFLGTRYGVSVFLLAVSQGLILWTVSNFFTSSQISVSTIRRIAALLLCISTTLGFWQSMRPTADESRFDRLWFDFRDVFGIVWSIRIQDRINATADKEQWTVRLGPEGFNWDKNTTEDKRRQSESRLVHTLYWHLRRFVENEWIEERLGTPCPESLTSPQEIQTQ